MDGSVVLIDSHCHIDRFPDASALAQECESKQILTVAVTNVPSHFQLARRHLSNTKYVYPALGLHPLAVADCYRELPLFLEYLPKADFIGEIGLDFSRDGTKSRVKQLDVFTSIAEALSGTTKFVTIHSKGAADEVLGVLKRFDTRNVVFHWYSGSLRTLDEAIEFGCLFSVNPSMISSQSGAKVVSRIPKDRLLTESDGPYVRIGTRPAQPSDVQLVISWLAETWRQKEDETEVLIVDNFNRMWGAKPKAHKLDRDPTSLDRNRKIENGSNK